MSSSVNFFLAGAQKGGTSTLHLWLRQHPDVYLSPRKELHYFCNCPDPELRAVNSDAEYLAHFAPAPASAVVVGESSPCYLYYPKALAEIVQRFPGTRFLVSLRDPVERFWSHYLMNLVYRPQQTPEASEIVDRHQQGATLLNALDDLVGVSQYAPQVESLWSVAGRDQTQVIFLEEMASAPDAVIETVLSFLDLRPNPIDTAQRDKVYVEPRNAFGRLTLRNPTVRRIGVALIPPRQRHYLRTRWLGSSDLKPEMEASLRDRLREILAPDSRRLEEALGRPLPWDWHRS